MLVWVLISLWILKSFDFVIWGYIFHLVLISDQKGGLSMVESRLFERTRWNRSRSVEFDTTRKNFSAREGSNSSDEIPRIEPGIDVDCNSKQLHKRPHLIQANQGMVLGRKSRRHAMLEVKFKYQPNG